MTYLKTFNIAQYRQENECSMVHTMVMIIVKYTKSVSEFGSVGTLKLCEFFFTIYRIKEYEKYAVTNILKVFTWSIYFSSFPINQTVLQILCYQLGVIDMN